MRKKIFYTLLFGIGLLSACMDQQEDLCLSNQQSVQVGFYSANTEAHSDTTIYQFSAFGPGRVDSMYESKTVSKAFLPLSLQEDITKIVLQINGLTDTITFKHNKELEFVSGECGFVFNLELENFEYTQYNFIDHVEMVYPSIKYGENIENVKIYLY